MNTNVCNIGPKEIAKRKRMGFVLLILAGFTSGMLIALHTPFFMRLIVFPIFAGGFIGLLEAHQKVCILHAWKKTNKMS